MLSAAAIRAIVASYKEDHFMFPLLLMVVVVSAGWVYSDAKKIGARKGLIQGLGDMGPGGWAAVTLFFWIVGFPLYLSKRSTIEQAAAGSGGSGTRTCPQCAEQIQMAAIKCKHCGSDVAPLK